LHAVFELAPMRVSVTACTAQAGPVVNHRRRFEVIRLFVAVAARDSDVSPGKDESRLLVLRHGEGGRLVAIECVAAFTSIEVRRSGKLPSMLLGVTIGATRERHLEARIGAFRNVALRAFELGMAALERIRRRRVVLDGKRGRFPAIYCMARCAFSVVRPLHELPVVRIRFVTVHALLEGKRLFEVTAAVALNTTYILMLAKQRKACSGMIESLIDCFR
jgi:hypothetical protein